MNLTKKITIAKNAGFCFGVRRAIKLATETAKTGRNVFMLGDIVHNQRVVNDIRKAGIKKIQRLPRKSSGTLIIRAHGAAKETFLRAARAGYTIVDATCPMVKEIHKIAREQEKKGLTIVVIGEKDHEEVKGIIGNLENPAIVLSVQNRLPLQKLRGIKNAAVVVQSTQNEEKVLEILEKLRKVIKQITFCNTICHPTRQKQKEIRELPAQNEVMIVIGAGNSANTRRLYELSKESNPNTYRVNAKSELKKSWFKNKRKIGIAAGASTPDYIIKEIADYIRKL